MVVSIFFDEYQGKAGLESIKGDAESIQIVLEDKQNFRYKFPSEDPELFEPNQFENLRKFQEKHDIICHKCDNRVK